MDAAAYARSHAEPPGGEPGAHRTRGAFHERPRRDSDVGGRQEAR